LATKRPRTPSTQQTFDAKQIFSMAGNAWRSIRYENKDTIIRQGDPADAVYYIEKGSVLITVVSDQGKQGIIGILSAGAFFGEGSLTGQVLYLSSVSANKPTTVITINKLAMQRVLQEQPKFSEMFMSFLLTRNGQIEADLVDQLFNSSEKRLARVLLLLANFGKDGTLEVVVPKVSQDDLAARVGTTRARVNFFMNKFRKMGLIAYDKDELMVHSALVNIIVHD